jgi:hypothetical protein
LVQDRAVQFTRALDERYRENLLACHRKNRKILWAFWARARHFFSKHGLPD